MSRLIEGEGKRVEAQEMECWMRLCTKALELELTEEDAEKAWREEYGLERTAEDAETVRKALADRARVRAVLQERLAQTTPAGS